MVYFPMSSIVLTFQVLQAEHLNIKDLLMLISIKIDICFFTLVTISFRNLYLRFHPKVYLGKVKF